MLRVWRELTGRGATIQTFREEANNAIALRQRRSTQVSEESPRREPAVHTDQDNLLAAGAHGRKRIQCTQIIIPHYSPIKALWDWITLLLILYTAVCTPYMAAFLLADKSPIGETLVGTSGDEDGNDTWSNSTAPTATAGSTKAPLSWATNDVLFTLNRVDKFVDVMFIMDILINFRTTYLHNGEVIDDPRKIASNYVRGWFFIDAVAAIPFDLLLQHTGTSDTMTMTGVLKTARLLRLLRVARRIDQYSEYGAAVLILLMAIFTLIAHWLACLFYLLTSYERSSFEADISWLDKLAVNENALYIVNASDSGPSLRSRYITSLYFCFTILTSVGFGNVAPNTNVEKVFTIFAMLLGSLMSAAIFGNVSSIMLRLYRGAEEYHEKLASIKEFVKFHSIPKLLANRLTESYQHSRSLTQGVDMNAILKGFPDCLQADICLHLNRNLLSNCRAFKQASPGCLRALSTKFKSTHVPPGDPLIHPGDILDSIYFIARGTIEIIKDEDIFMAILGKDDIFGEDIKKWYFDEENNQGKSDYSVRAMSFCDLHMITIADLRDIMDSYPEFAGDFLQNFGVTFNLRREERAAAVKEDHKMMQFIRLRRRKSYFPDQKQLQTESPYRSSSGTSRAMTSQKSAASRPPRTRAPWRHRASSSFEAALSADDEDDLELSPQLPRNSGLLDKNSRKPLVKKFPKSRGNGYGTYGHQTDEEKSDELRLWQINERVEKWNNYTKLQTLPYNQYRDNTDDVIPSCFKQNSTSPATLTELNGIHSAEAGDGSLIMDSSVPAPDARSSVILSPTPSVTNSTTYAHKLVQDGSRDPQSPEQRGVVVVRNPGGLEVDVSAAAESSTEVVDYLWVLDERLNEISQRLTNFEDTLCTTVDAILEALGYEPSIVRKVHGQPGAPIVRQVQGQLCSDHQRAPRLAATADIPSFTSYASTSCSADEDVNFTSVVV